MLKLLIVGLLISSTTYADTIPEYFSSLNQITKGAFGSNMMQGWSRRRTYKDWEATGRPGTYFQSAFRNDTAYDLLDEHGMYTGNLFTTNYYELRAEFLLGDRNADDLSREQGLESLIAASQGNPLIYARATQMVQNWNLEKLYVLKNPSSKIANGFQLRGVGGAEFEQKYGQEFVNYYVHETGNNLELLALIKLADSSALFSSSNFGRIRNKATSLYVNYPNREIKKIRDSIHNQLTPDVIVKIDRYLESHSSGRSALLEIRGLITTYFAQGVSDINHIAKKANIPNGGLSAINTRDPELSDLQAYADNLVSLRNKMLTDEVSLNEKYIYLGYTSVASTFLFEKTKAYVLENAINSTNIREVTEILLNLLYLKGLVGAEMIGLASTVPTDFDGYEEFFDELLSELIGNVKNAYGVYISKWGEVEPHIDGIVDDSLRASSISLFDQILDKMD